MARANENASAQGNFDLNRRFMVFKRAEASSADWPPDKNAIPGTAAGTVRHRLFTVMLATSSTDACVGQVNPGSTMLGFRIMPSSSTRWQLSWMKTFRRTSSVDFAASLQSMRAVHQHFRFDNRNQSGFLAQRGVARQRVCVGFDATPAGNAIADGNHRPPLGKTRAHLKIFLESVAQAVQTFGDFFAGRTSQLFCSSINFDAGNDSRIGRGL